MQKVKFGKHRQRRSYARISEVIDLPDLIEIQTLSYEKFLETGLKDVFRDVSPIEGNNDKLSLEFIDYKLGTPKYNVDESKERDATKPSQYPFQNSVPAYSKYRQRQRRKSKKCNSFS